MRTPLLHDRVVPLLAAPTLAAAGVLAPHGGAGPVPKEIRPSRWETIDGHATPRVVDVAGPDDAWRTVYRLDDVRYDVGLSDAVFSLSRLNRGR
ncbi:MAG: hypothetical protein AB1689_08025 [Thermodesulfobacteriota bacterium]